MLSWGCRLARNARHGPRAGRTPTQTQRTPTNPPPPPPVSTRVAAAPKSGALALALEVLVPGAGMLYAGRVRLGFTWLCATLLGSLGGLAALGATRNPPYRASLLGIFALALAAWLVVRCLLAFAAARERGALAMDMARHPGMTRAHGLLWLAIALELVTVGVGLPADRGWHATHPFDGFFSPPHDFIYASVLVNACVVAYMVFAPHVRAWFGPGFRLPPFPFEVPGALALTGGGLVTLALAGTLDSLWHTAFGLDETGWSTPHAMLGWGLLMLFLGFVACRLALRPYRPLRWYTVLVFGLLMIGFTATPFMGPLHANTTLERVAAIAHIPVIFAQQAALHTFRIYLKWNITRTNPIFVPLAALWAGAALALVRRLDRRAWPLLLVALLWTLLSLAGDRGDARRLDAYLQVTDFAQRPANWLPLPLLPAAATFLLARLARLPERWAWPPAGLVYGLCVVAIWGPYAPFGPALIPLAAPVLLLGALLGEGVFAVLARPIRGRTWALLLLGVGAPLVTGMADLYLRLNTP